MFKKYYAILLILFTLVYFYSCTPSQQTITPPANWPVISKNENDFKKYFDDQINSLDKIEGIWGVKSEGSWRNVLTGANGNFPPMNLYRIAIIRDTTKPGYDFIAVILESNDAFKPGFVKAYFRKTAYEGVYEGLWYMADFSIEKTNYVVDENGLIKTTIIKYFQNNEGKYEMTLIKAYPQLNKNILSKSDNKLKSSGSGFLISSNGLIVTNYHVVEGANKIDVIFPEKGLTKSANIRIKDSKNDIAILEIPDFSFASYFSQPVPYVLSDINTIKVGEEVFTLGFPLGEMMGAKSRLSNGRINSLYGLQDDPRLFQISNPLQPGNSGGPLFNNKGELVGLVVSSLNAKYFYENAGIIPQNVNFAIKSTYLQNLISMIPVGDDILKRKNLVKQGKMEDQIEQLNPFIVQIKVY
jgi:S1-C subfamily serine protease